MTGDRADVQRAVNQLIAAAIAWRVAAPGHDVSAAVTRLAAAIIQYERVRSEGDAARDDFLARYPTPADLQDAVDDLLADGRRHHGVYSRGVPDVDAAMDAAEKIPGAWVGPEGNLHCPAHIDGCPPPGHERAHR